MSAAAAAATDATEVPKKKRLSKKLLLIVGGVVAVLALAGGGAAYFMKKKAADAAATAAAEGGEDEARAEDKPKKRDAKAVPTFLPIDPFVVNLADREHERFAQIGVTLQVADPKAAEQLKLYMPAIRNGVLLVLAHKTSDELLERAGKEKLAREIMREAVRPLGIEIDAEDDDAKPGKKRKPAADDEPNPVEHVHFSSFIIQ